MLIITMASYINLLYTHMNNLWNEYLKLESFIHKLETFNHPMVPLLLQRIISLKYETFQQWKHIKTKIEIIYSRPTNYMKFMFPNHNIHQIWS